MSIRVISALDPALRHAQTPGPLSPAKQVYEWWYFEVEFKDRDDKPWRVITSFHYPHGVDPHRLLAHMRYTHKGTDYFAAYGDNPADYAGIATYVVDVTNSKNVALLIARFPKSQIGARVSVSKPGDPKVELVFGDSSFKQNNDGTYTLIVKHQGWHYVRQRFLSIDMKVTFGQNTPGFQPTDGLLIEQTGAKHNWACVMPNPTVHIDHCVVERDRKPGGSKVLVRARANTAGGGGYHDHQWGEDLMYKQIDRWNWGRVPTGGRGAALPRDKVLFFDVVGLGSPGFPAQRPDPILVEVPGDGSAPFALSTVPGQDPFHSFGNETMNFADGCQLGIQGQNIPYHRWIYLRAKTAGGGKREFNVEHRVAHNVDTWPFYLRFQPAVYDYNSGRTFWSISEIMQADRMTTADAKKVLAMSDKVTVGA
jgi:hypothetical protein